MTRLGKGRRCHYQHRLRRCTREVQPGESFCAIHERKMTEQYDRLGYVPVVVNDNVTMTVSKETTGILYREPTEDETMARGTLTRCKATKASGVRCTKRSRKGDEFCAYHQKKKKSDADDGFDAWTSSAPEVSSSLPNRVNGEKDEQSKHRSEASEMSITRAVASFETIDISTPDGTVTKTYKIDADSAEKIRLYHWVLAPRSKSGVLCPISSSTSLHQFVLWTRPGEAVRFLNGDHSDCRRNNLEVRYRRGVKPDVEHLRYLAPVDPGTPSKWEWNDAEDRWFELAREVSFSLKGYKTEDAHTAQLEQRIAELEDSLESERSRRALADQEALEMIEDAERRAKEATEKASAVVVSSGNACAPWDRFREWVRMTKITMPEMSLTVEQIDSMCCRLEQS